ncbi:MAG: hypothetical protein EON58_13110, partial [Alphaproteobacteria bacterium]
MTDRLTCSHSSTLTPATIREFVEASQASWRVGVPLVELLARINLVAAVLVGGGSPKAPVTGRVKPIFTMRSFRHYQTLGCIDAPERTGKQADYGFRHFVQALLVRRLLWERMSSEQILALMEGRSTEVTKRMLFKGIKMSARHFVGNSGSTRLTDEGVVGIWKR